MVQEMLQPIHLCAACLVSRRLYLLTQSPSTHNQILKSVCVKSIIWSVCQSSGLNVYFQVIESK